MKNAWKEPEIEELNISKTKTQNVSTQNNENNISDYQFPSGAGNNQA